MASKYSIETTYRLIDKITAPLDKIGIKGKTVGRSLKNDFLKTEQQLANVGGKLKTFAKRATLTGVAVAGLGLGMASRQFIDYNAAITGATAKFKDLDVTSQDYKSNLEAVGQVARRVASVTEFNAVDTAGALDKMAMAGLSSKQSMALLAGTTNLATAAGTDLTSAVDIATDALGAFGLMTNDEKVLEGNLNRLSDVMAKTTNMFNTDIGGFFESAKMGAATFTSAGQSLEDFSAMVGVLASSGVKGAESGTQLRNMMLSLASPSKMAQGALDNLGVKTKDANGNFLNVIDILGQFEQGLSGLGDAEKSAALTKIFGKRTVTGVTLLLAEGAEGLKKYSKQLDNTTGASAKLAGAMRGSLKNKIEILKSALTELGFKFVSAFSQKGAGAISTLTEAVSNFDPASVINFLKIGFTVVSKVVGILWKMRTIIETLVISWGLYKTAMVGAVAVSKIMGLVNAVTVLMNAQKGMNVVQAIFNVLLTANPIGLVVAGIGALIAVVLLCVKYWDQLSAGISVAWAWIVKAGKAVFGFVNIFTGGIFEPVFNMIQGVWNAISRIAGVFMDGGIIAGIKQIGAEILSGLLYPIQYLLELIAKIPGVGGLIQPALDKLESFRNGLTGIEPSININHSGELDGVQSSSLAPVSSAQQNAYYSRQDSYQHTEISVRAEQGSRAKVTQRPKSPNFNLAVSGGASW